jgi:hypothetical protein
MMGLPKCWSWPGSLWSAIIWKHDGMCSSNVAIYPYNLSDSFSMSSISRRFWVVLCSGSELCHTVEHAKAFLRSSHKNSLNYQGWKLGAVCIHTLWEPVNALPPCSSTLVFYFGAKGVCNPTRFYLIYYDRLNRVIDTYIHMLLI